MKSIVATYIIIVLLVSIGSSQKRDGDRAVGGPCDRCDLMFLDMPAQIVSSIQIAPNGEPGDPLIMTGTLYQRDGKTPAPGIILYVYHTDANGKYSPAPSNNSGNVHGHLRGWMKSDAQGRYEFRTIRPAAYPGRNAPQHIHAIVKEPGISLYWIDEYVFDDDPILKPEERKKTKNRGGSGIIHVVKNKKGEWIGQRDIILGLQIPSY